MQYQEDIIKLFEKLKISFLKSILRTTKYLSRNNLKLYFFSKNLAQI